MFGRTLRKTDHVNRSWVRVRAAVAELAVAVVAPALNPTVGEKSAGVPVTGTYLGGVRDTTDLDRSQASFLQAVMPVVRGQVAELARPFFAPALDSAAAKYSAGETFGSVFDVVEVVVAGANGGGILDAPGRDWQSIALSLAIPELAGMVIAPTLNLAARKDNARMECAGADHPGIRDALIFVAGLLVAGLPTLDLPVAEKGTERPLKVANAHRDSVSDAMNRNGNSLAEAPTLDCAAA